MLLLIAFAFIAGIVTVLSPCILPLLPIILSSSDSSGKQKPLGVVIGFIASFTFFTLFLSAIVRLSGISSESLRIFSILVLAVFGASLLVPQIQTKLEIVFGKLANVMPSSAKRSGFWGGLMIGFSLGLLWTPCVGPILASVISLAITGAVTIQAFLLTLAYALGTAIPMFAIMLAGSKALQKVPWLVRNTGLIQKVFGMLMILTALGIFFNIDRRFQTFILETFPNYGIGLTQFEDNELVKNQLDQLHKETSSDSDKSTSPSNSIDSSSKPAPELVSDGNWFNSEPLTLQKLRGKVVLIDFWTYSCINCQRTLPYLRTWWEKYEQDGLVIIGVHAPEFEFEKNPDNVAQAIEDFELLYPIVQDNNFATWKAYKNRYWPAKYLLDKQGVVRYTHFGEGKYDETEQKIQELLSETGSAFSPKPVNNPKYKTFTRTPEIYLGYDRIEYLSSPETIVKDQPMHFSLPNELPANSFALEGSWQITPEYAVPVILGSTLKLSFEAQNVFLVARPKQKAAKLRVSIDGEVNINSVDVVNGVVSIDADKLYNLISLDSPGKHTVILELIEGEVELYAFTFG